MGSTNRTKRRAGHFRRSAEKSNRARNGLIACVLISVSYVGCCPPKAHVVYPCSPAFEFDVLPRDSRLGLGLAVGNYTYDPAINFSGFSAAIQGVYTVISDPQGSDAFYHRNNTNFLFTTSDPPGGKFQSLGANLEWNLPGTVTPTANGYNFTLSGTTSVNGITGVQANITGNVVGTNFTGTASYLAPVDTSPSKYSLIGNVRSLASPRAENAAGAALDPVRMNTGAYDSDPQADLVEGGPLTLQFLRSYDSLYKLNGFSSSLGNNWMNNFESRLVIAGTQATVMLYGGGMIQFAASGTKWALTSPQPLSYQLVQNGTAYQFLDPASNRTYSFNNVGQLTSIADRNGNTLTVAQSSAGPTTVSDGLGRSLAFTYSAAGNLTSVKDQGGRTVLFTYSTNNLATVTDANGKVTTYNYTTAGGIAGLLVSVKRPNGNTTILQTYDQFARVIGQTDGTNDMSTIVYDPANPGSSTATDPLSFKTLFAHSNLQDENEIIDPNGKSTNVVYDSANRPIQITDRLGNKTLITYDPASGLRATFTDADGNVTAYTYAAQTQGSFTFYLLAKITLPDGSSVSYSYDAKGNLMKAVDQLGKALQYTVNSRGQRLTETNALGGVTTYTYNANGTRASMTTPAGDATQYGYDSINRLNKVTYPDASTESYGYDARDRVTQHTVGAGSPQNSSYDGNGNLVSQSDASGNLSNYGYDANDRQISVTTATGTRTTTYDANGREATRTDEAGEKTSFVYDPDGRPLKVLNGAGNGPQYGWNADGFEQSYTDALSNVTMIAADPVGLALSLVNALQQKFVMIYDNLRRPLKMTSPLGTFATVTYDARGDVTTITQGSSISAAYSYNDAGERSAVQDPNGNTWTTSFDMMGRPTGFTDPLSRSTATQYDSRNRPKSVTTSSGSANLTFSSSGRLTEIKYSDGTDLQYQYTGTRVSGADSLSLGYDSLHGITSSNGITGTRDALNRLTSVTYAKGLTVTYKYNNVGDLTEIDDWLGGVTTLQHDAAHHLTSVTRPNGVVTTSTYDAAAELIGKTVTAGTAVYAIQLTHDARGNVLTSNRTLPQALQPASGVNNYSYDAASQPTGSSDALGRVTSDGILKYTWNLASRLMSYTGATGAAQFKYDGFGQMVARITSTSETDYVWNYAHSRPVVAILRAGGADIRYYIYTPAGSLVYSIEASGNARHYFHFDESGSTAFLTDDTGAVSDSYASGPFGEDVMHTGNSDNPFTFQGAYGVMQDPGTGLYYMRARWYSSALARFLSPDPIRSIAPLRINPYQYAVNDPVNSTDPSGMEAETQARALGRVIVDAILDYFCWCDSDSCDSGFQVYNPFYDALVQPGFGQSPLEAHEAPLSLHLNLPESYGPLGNSLGALSSFAQMPGNFAIPLIQLEAQPPAANTPDIPVPAEAVPEHIDVM